METNRKKRIKAMLPLFALPFAAILFYVFGGGKQSPDGEANSGGLNTFLPSPADNSETLDKLSLYRKLERDSLEERKRYDPFDMFGDQTEDTASSASEGAVTSPFSNDDIIPSAARPSRRTRPDAQLDNMERKLAELQAIIDAPASSPAIVPSSSQSTVERNLQDFSHLENMMQSIKEEPTGDKELQQMSGMLEKILDIQHPQRVMDRAKEASAQNTSKAFPIENVNRKLSPDYFGTAKTDSAVVGKNLFYDNAEIDTTKSGSNLAIAAVVHDQQTLVSGAFVKIRTRQPFYVAGMLIPTGSFLFGNCTLSGERLMVSISSIRSGNSVLPVSLSVYDLDGNPGIRVPGSISRDASKQSTDQAIQQVALNSLDPSLTAQATTAAVETAKSLISKKVRLIKVTVKSDYPVLLKSDQ